MVRLTRRDHARAIAQLLPPGAALTRDPDTVLGKLMLGLAGETERLSNRTLDLIEEADPRTTVEMVGDWERILGLPSACGTPPDTLEGRRAAILARLLASGGSSRAALVALAAAMGEHIRIIERRPIQFGLTCFGDGSEFGEDKTRFLWTIELDGREEHCFEVGVGELGVTPFSWIDQPEGVICALAELAPAHTEFAVTFTGLDAPTILYLSIARTPGIIWQVLMGANGLEIRGPGDGIDLLLAGGTLPLTKAGGESCPITLTPNGGRWLLRIGREGGGEYQVDVDPDRLRLNGGASRTLNIPPVNGGIPVRMASGEVLYANLKEL